jgi:hypothetical protein
LGSEVLVTSSRASHQKLHNQEKSVKPNINKELNASPIQGEEVVQGEITTHEVCITIK